MSKTLVIILSETREYELTFDNFKKNVIDRLDADLCLCIGIKSDYNYNNPFYQLAKYKFLYNEPEDFGDAFEYAYNILSKNIPKYEILENINTLHGKLKSPDESKENINYYGNINNIDIDIDILNNINDDEIIFHKNNFCDNLWKNRLYGINKTNNDNYIYEQNIVTYKKPLYWREFLKIKDHLFGGVKDSENQHLGSAGILIFFRWFLLKNLIDNNLINEYDRFVITRSDYIYNLPYPKLEYMPNDYIWIPNSEYYGGYTDRNVILSKTNIVQYLNIFNNFVLRSNEYYMKLKKEYFWNLEKLIKFHLEQNNVLHLVKEFPYIMYSVRNINGSTRWNKGIYSDDLGYYIKYQGEFCISLYYKYFFEKYDLDIDNFYINVLNNNIKLDIDHFYIKNVNNIIKVTLKK